MRAQRFKGPNRPDQKTIDRTIILTWFVAPLVLAGMFKLLGFLGQ